MVLELHLLCTVCVQREYLIVVWAEIKHCLSSRVYYHACLLSGGLGQLGTGLAQVLR